VFAHVPGLKLVRVLRRFNAAGTDGRCAPCDARDSIYRANSKPYPRELAAVPMADAVGDSTLPQGWRTTNAPLQYRRSNGDRYVRGEGRCNTGSPYAVVMTFLYITCFSIKLRKR
jgi:hypothetical protein